MRYVSGDTCLDFPITQASVRKQIDLFSRFDTLPACDRQTHRHRAITVLAYHRVSKN